MQRRIWLAKSRWYAWLKKNDALTGKRQEIRLEIREYDWDPSVRLLALGETEGFFGIYVINDASPSSAQHVKPAPDWKASRTRMIQPEPDSLAMLIESFDQLWKRARSPEYDEYRFEASERLWVLATNRADIDTIFADWTTETRQAISTVARPTDVPNLVFPKNSARTPLAAVDVMGSVVTDLAGKTILVCEIRNRNETWEGLGKTSTWLELIGLRPVCLTSEGRVATTSSLHELVHKIRLHHWHPAWHETQSKPPGRLFASDFVWVWTEDGRLCVSQPEGEFAWGLWDASRQLLRSSVQIKQEGFQRFEDSRTAQMEIYGALPSQPLHERYSFSPESVTPDAIVVLRPMTDLAAREVSQLTGTAGPDCFQHALESARHHPSRFWYGSERDVEHHNEMARETVAAVTTWPPVFSVTGPFPIGSVAKTIREQLLPLLKSN